MSNNILVCSKFQLKILFSSELLFVIDRKENYLKNFSFNLLQDTLFELRKMPIFNKKPKQSPTTIQQQQQQQYENNNSKTSSTSPMNSVERRVPQPQPTESNVSKPQLVFHCQLAHGSPTGLISGFASVKELYQKIAECYDFSVDEVSYFILHLSRR